VPLRISRDRVWLYGITLLVLAVLPAVLAYPSDWQRFWAAGATAGTTALLNVEQHAAFQRAHGMSTALWLYPWAYPPVFAWAFTPTAHLPLAVGYALNFALTLAFVGLSGIILARAFGLSRRFGFIAALAWEPAIYSADVGQPSALWLLLISVAIAGAARRSALILGGAVGVLLLKPTIALPFVVLLLVRREWKACGVVAICAIVWYLGSVAASAGDWNWIPPYLAIVHSLYNTDLGALYNGITLPMILVRLGIAPSIALALGTIVFVGFLPALSRANILQALSFTSLLSLALSAHAWMYEVGLALPALFYAMVNVAEPWRTRLIVGAYLLAALWMPIDALIWFNPLAIITLGGIILCGVALYAKGFNAGQGRTAS
jgi:hypothetical protein